MTHETRPKAPRSRISLWLGGMALALALAPTLVAGELSPAAESERQAPGFDLQALDGTPHRLEDYRGKVVLLNFWASWCPPCLVELPSMQRLADQLAADPFAVVLVNVQETPFRVANSLKLMGVRVTTLLDPEGDTFRAWGGAIYPTSFVIDPEGQVRYVAKGPLEWDSQDVLTALQGLLPPRQAADD
ncbi:MAG: TlpA family protein disulfide reductase [Bdellovibrio bacteriovorus]